MSNKIDYDLAQKWIAALRSGKYKQCKNSLRDMQNGFCCLGVLYDIQGGNWDTIDVTEVLPSEKAGGLFYGQQKYLAKMNDSIYSFTDIADYIERNFCGEQIKA